MPEFRYSSTASLRIYTRAWTDFSPNGSVSKCQKIAPLRRKNFLTSWSQGRISS